jgi:HAMP domain-containing protein
VVDQYGPNNGFGWKLNETVGAQIVSVPESLVIATADRALTGLVIDLGILSLFTLISLDLLLIFAVVRPVSRLSRTADEISRGNMDVEELPVRGRDEISILATSFNRMQRSLQRAMKLLSSEDDSPVSGGQE